MRLKRYTSLDALEVHVELEVAPELWRAVLDAFEREVCAHLDEHATNGAPPVDEPPPWHELEHCDGGATCEHAACLADAELEARLTAAD